MKYLGYALSLLPIKPENNPTERLKQHNYDYSISSDIVPEIYNDNYRDIC